MAWKPYQDPTERHSLGRMDVLCLDCGALHWLAEKYVSSSQCNPTFRTCCYEGWVHLLALEAPPEPLHTLLTSNNHESKSFWEDIWKYNRALAFTSLGVNEDHSINCSARKSGPVWFFGPKKKDWDWDQSRHFLKPKRLDQDRKRPRLRSFSIFGLVLV